MIVSLFPTQAQVLNVLRSGFLQQVLPQGSAMFAGSVSGTTLTALPNALSGKLQVGTIVVGDVLFGVGVVPGTQVVSQLSGPAGGPGTYQLNQAQSVSGVPLNTGIPVILAQQNRVSQPAAQDFAIVTLLSKSRFTTNIDDYVDCYFDASIAGSVMTVEEVYYGDLTVGAQVFGEGLAVSTVITGQTSGNPGEAGAYTVSVPQTVALEGMACGTAAMLQEAEWLIQVTFFGPNSNDYSSIVATAFRDEYASELFAQAEGIGQFAIGVSTIGGNLPIGPLYADDPKQLPFIDGEQQYETSWMTTLHLQVNQIVTVPQQFADVLTVGLIEIEAVYPN